MGNSEAFTLSYLSVESSPLSMVPIVRAAALSSVGTRAAVYDITPPIAQLRPVAQSPWASCDKSLPLGKTARHWSIDYSSLINNQN